MQKSINLVLMSVILAIFFPWSLLICYLFLGYNLTVQIVLKIIKNRDALIGGLVAGLTGLALMVIWLFQLLP